MLDDAVDRRGTLVAIGVGALTAFLPLVTVAGPGAASTTWSVRRLLSFVAVHQAPLSTALLNLFLSGLVVFYLSLGAVLVLIWIPRTRPLRIAIAFMGALGGYDPFYWTPHVLDVLFGSNPLAWRGMVVHREPGMFVIAIVMPLLLLIMWNEEPPARERGALDPRPADT